MMPGIEKFHRLPIGNDTNMLEVGVGENCEKFIGAEPADSHVQKNTFRDAFF